MILSPSPCSAELKVLNNNDIDNPINVIATQMRKFGLGLVMPSQSPVHLYDNFVKNVGTGRKSTGGLNRPLSNAAVNSIWQRPLQFTKVEPVRDRKTVLSAVPDVLSPDEIAAKLQSPTNNLRAALPRVSESIGHLVTRGIQSRSGKPPFGGIMELFFGT